jgi:orotidine-5'-phosphate decarboxylase
MNDVKKEIMNFKNKVRQKIIEKGNPLCLGIDPHFDDLPLFMRKFKGDQGEIFLLEKFTQSLIEAATGRVPAVKFQMSFYEKFGWEGFKVLEEGISKANNSDLLTILDGKRGDISSTMKSYGVMAFDRFHADCLTVTPYMGSDVIKPLLPWLKDGKGLYVVWVTSNPSGATIQEDVQVDDKIVAEYLLDVLDVEICKAANWRQEELDNSIGVVLGATKLDRLSDQLINRINSRPILLPGVGPQGGVVSPKMKTLLSSQIHLIPMSRGLAGLGSSADLDQLESLKNWNEYIEFVQKKIESAAKLL